MIKKVSDLLKKFTYLKPHKTVIEKELPAVIKDILGRNTDISIVYKKPNLYIKTKDPYLKNIIFLKKEEIIEKIKNRFNQEYIKIWFN
jgi:hypothetical protein